MKKCTAVCSGHYLEPEDHIKWVEENGAAACEKNTCNKILPEDIEELSKSNLLSREDTHICVEHFVSICERTMRNNQKQKKKKLMG